MAYFVVYQVHIKDRAKPMPPSNVILRRTHPVQWAANSAIEEQYGILTTLLFWSEIPDEMTEAAKGWCGIEE